MFKQTKPAPWKSGRIQTEGLLDKECFDNIELDVNLMVPWFVVSCYGRANGKPVLGETMHQRLSKKLVQNIEEISHRHVGLIDIESAKKGEFSGEYPPNMEMNFNLFVRTFLS